MIFLARVFYVLAILWAVIMGILLIGVVITAPSISEGIEKLITLLFDPLILVYFVPSLTLYFVGDWIKRKKQP